MKKLIILLFILTISLYAKQSKLKYIIDGDTIVFTSETCRLAYIDTPESKRNSKATRDIANCNDVTLDEIIESGRYAKRYLKSILQKGKNYNFDVIGKDRYKRSICIIYKNNENINQNLVKNGFAIPFWKYIKSQEIKSIMVKSLDFAKKNKKGLWRVYPSVLNCMDK